MKKLILVLCGFLLVGFLGCRKKDDKGSSGKDAPTIPLAEREISLMGGEFVVKGPLPDWPDHPQGRGLALREDFDDMTDVMKLSLQLGIIGGTGIDREQMKKELAKTKKNEMEFGSPKVIKDVSEISPGVWSLVVMREGFTIEGQKEYSIKVLRLPESDDGMGLICSAGTRFDHAEKWKQLESICAGLSLKKK